MTTTLEATRSAPPKYCAAPFIQAFLRVDGETWPCCRNPSSLGNWQTEGGLLEVWNGDAYRAFRQDILLGRFPNERCQKCYAAFTTMPMDSLLYHPYFRFLELLRRHLPSASVLEPLNVLRHIFQKTNADEESGVLIWSGLEALRAVERAHGYLPQVALAARKLRSILACASAFLEGDLEPLSVAPSRNVSLQARCFARCQHCKHTYFHHTGPVRLPKEHLEGAFAFSDSLFTFASTTEFMYYPHWREVCHSLSKEHIALNLSTNGMLLTEDSARLLVDGHLIASLNISLEGGRPETIERIREGVNFQLTEKNLRFLFQYASERRYDFRLSFSMVLLRQNYLELGDLVRLLNRIRGDHPFPSRTLVRVQSLVPAGAIEGYRQFYLREHHSRIPREDLEAAFREALEASRETGIDVQLFSSFLLPDFLDRGCPLPPFQEDEGDDDLE